MGSELSKPSKRTMAFVGVGLVTSIMAYFYYKRLAV
jgi:hypothetical protein